MGSTVLRVRTVFTGVAGSPWYSNLHWAADEDEPEAVACSNRTRAFWSGLAGLMGTAVQGDVESAVTRIDIVTGDVVSVEDVPQTPFAGSQSTDLLPLATQGLITLRTGAYRFGRPIVGKIFVPGFTEVSNTAGNVETSALATLNQSAAGLLTGEPATGRLAVYSRPRGRIEGAVIVTVPGASSNVSSASAAAKWSVLRSRRD